MAKLEQRYESVLIVSTKLGEEGIAALIKKFSDMISAAATLESVDEWGKRRLVYPINYENDGFYVLFHFTSKPDFPAELDRVYRITDGILRSLIIAKPEVKEKPKKVKKAVEPAAQK